MHPDDLLKPNALILCLPSRKRFALRFVCSPFRADSREHQFIPFSAKLPDPGIFITQMGLGERRQFNSIGTHKKEFNCMTSQTRTIDQPVTGRAAWLVRILLACLTLVLVTYAPWAAAAPQAMAMPPAAPARSSERTATRPGPAGAAAKAYIGLFKDNAVAVLDTGRNRVLRTIPIAAGPHGLVITPDGRTVYVSSDGASTVSVIDTATDQVKRTIEVGKMPHGL